MMATGPSGAMQDGRTGWQTLQDAQAVLRYATPIHSVCIQERTSLFFQKWKTLLCETKRSMYEGLTKSTHTRALLTATQSLTLAYFLGKPPSHCEELFAHIKKLAMDCKISAHGVQMLISYVFKNMSMAADQLVAELRPQNAPEGSQPAPSSAPSMAAASNAYSDAYANGYDDDGKGAKGRQTRAARRAAAATTSTPIQPSATPMPPMPAPVLPGMVVAPPPPSGSNNNTTNNRVSPTWKGGSTSGVGSKRGATSSSTSEPSTKRAHAGGMMMPDNGMMPNPMNPMDPMGMLNMNMPPAGMMPMGGNAPGFNMPGMPPFNMSDMNGLPGMHNLPGVPPISGMIPNNNNNSGNTWLPDPSFMPGMVPNSAPMPSGPGMVPLNDVSGGGSGMMPAPGMNMGMPGLPFGDIKQENPGTGFMQQQAQPTTSQNNFAGPFGNRRMSSTVSQSTSAGALPMGGPAALPASNAAPQGDMQTAPSGPLLVDNFLAPGPSAQPGWMGGLDNFLLSTTPKPEGPETGTGHPSNNPQDQSKAQGPTTSARTSNSQGGHNNMNTNNFATMFGASTSQLQYPSQTQSPALSQPPQQATPPLPAASWGSMGFPGADQQQAAARPTTSQQSQQHTGGSMQRRPSTATVTQGNALSPMDSMPAPALQDRQQQPGNTSRATTPLQPSPQVKLEIKSEDAGLVALQSTDPANDLLLGNTSSFGGIFDLGDGQDSLTLLRPPSNPQPTDQGDLLNSSADVGGVPADMLLGLPSAGLGLGLQDGVTADAQQGTAQQQQQGFDQVLPDDALQLTHEAAQQEALPDLKQEPHHNQQQQQQGHQSSPTGVGDADLSS